MMLGDWNCELTESPASDLLAAGGQVLLDAAFVDWANPPATRTRWIDYGIGSSSLGVRRRWDCAFAGKSDHRFVGYEIAGGGGGGPKEFVRRPYARLSRRSS